MPHPPGLDLLLSGNCPTLTSRSKPFSRKMGPKVWKSSDLEQQGLGEQQHNVPTEQERQPQGKGRSHRPQPGLSIQQEGTSPPMGGKSWVEITGLTWWS